MLYRFTWTVYAIADAVGPVLMCRAFDATGSYSAFFTKLALATFLIAALMLLMPATSRRPQSLGPRLLHQHRRPLGLAFTAW